MYSIRNCDVVARWGGDEFLIIAPYTNLENMDLIVKRIEKGLQGNCLKRWE